MKSFALAVAVLVIGAVAAHADPGAAASRIEDAVGEWRGKATWKGCAVAGGKQASIDVSWHDGAFHAQLAGARDDLGEVVLAPAPGGDGSAQGARDDLKVTMSVARDGLRLTMSLSSDAGCAAQLTLTRDSTGLAGCDRLFALTRIASTCDAAGDARAADWDAMRKKPAAWKKLRGGDRRATNASCDKDADALAGSLAEQGCMPAASAGGTRIPECEAYVSAIKRYAQCAALPVEAKQALQQSMGQIVDSLRGSTSDARDAAAAACKQATEAIHDAAAAIGCSI